MIARTLDTNRSTKACTYARFLCEKAGVKFVLGSPQGKLQSLIVEQVGSEKKVTGITTADGQSHQADIVIVACESALSFLLSFCLPDTSTHRYAHRWWLDGHRHSRSPPHRRDHSRHVNVH